MSARQEMAEALAKKTGAGLVPCLTAVDFARGNPRLAMGYLRGSGFAVAMYDGRGVPLTMAQRAVHFCKREDKGERGDVCDKCNFEKGCWG